MKKWVLWLVGLAFLPGCMSPVPRSEWPDAKEPLYAHAVWIHQSTHYGSGGLIHSSAEHGTYVLTAAHVVSDGQFLDRKNKIEVGVWDLGHVESLKGDYALYEADIVAATLGDRPADNDLLLGFQNVLDFMGGTDIAVLRLQTNRLFHVAPLYTGRPKQLDGAAGQVVAVAPKMHPHTHPARFSPSSVICTEGENGNSGSPVYSEGQVAGVYSLKWGGAGPAKLHAFLREQSALSFMVAGTPAEEALPTTEMDESLDQHGGEGK